MAAQLSHIDHARLRTWTVTIAETLLPAGAQRQDRGGDWRFSGTGGLSIAKRSGAWFSHAAGIGDYSAVRLVELLRGCDRAEALQWAQAWLASHAGTGSCDGAEDTATSQAAAQANAVRAKAVIDAVLPPENTVVESYLRSRGIEPPYPECVRHLPDARIGESAMVGLLTAHDVVIGVQLTFLDPHGNKSLREPARQTFVLDRGRAKGAVFVVERLSSNAKMLLAEGMEDGLSLLACGRPEAIFALPGIGGLQHFPARRKQALTIVRDGDEPDSAADKALIKGLDHLLLQHAEVRVTQTPPGKDANNILREGGADVLNALVDAAGAAELSRDGEVKRLARLTEPADYDKERATIADKFGIRRSTLDAEVKKARPRPEKGKDEAPGSGLVEREPQPWHEPVRLAEVLTTLRDRLGRHIVFASPTQATAVTLWIAHTYVFDRFEYTPRLAIESATPRCGKTTLHDLLALTCCRPVAADRVTPASLVRMKTAIGAYTALLDEMGDTLRASPELDGVLRSGFQRNKRYINLKPLPDGGFEHESHDVFGPVAISLVGSVRGALGDRSIHIHLQRKAAATKVAKLRHGNNRSILLDCGRQLARWVADGAEALEDTPKIPEALNDRSGDFAIPLLTIAEQAGGTWPAEARAALVHLLAEGADRSEDEVIQLLHDIRAVFDADLVRRPVAPEHQEIESQQLVAGLLALPDSPWAQPENGRPLTQHKVARILRDFTIRPGNVGPKQARKRGYLRLQFTPAWAAYPDGFSPDPPASECTPAHNGGNPPDFTGFQSAHHGSGVHSENSARPAGNCGSVQGVHSDSGNSGAETQDTQFSASGRNLDGTNFSLHKPPGNEFTAVSDPPAAGPADPPDVGLAAAPGAPPAEPRPGNGAAPPQHASVATMIRLMAATHPDWSAERLAKASGQPVSLVKRALARTPRTPSNPPAGVH